MDFVEADEIIIPLSKSKVILLLLGALAFVGASLWIWFVADTQTRFNPLFMKGIAIVGAVFFALCAFYGCIKVFDSKPGLNTNQALHVTPRPPYWFRVTSVAGDTGRSKARLRNLAAELGDARERKKRPA